MLLQSPPEKLQIVPGAHGTLALEEMLCPVLG